MNNSPFSFLCSSPERASADVPVQQLPEGFLLQLAPAQPHLHPQLLQHLRHVSAQQGRVQQWKHLSLAAWSRSQKVPWVSPVLSIWGRYPKNGPGGGCCRDIQILKESLKKFPFAQRRLPKPPSPISPFCAQSPSSLHHLSMLEVVPAGFFGKFGTATLPSAVCQLWPDCNAPKLVLAVAWHHPHPGTTLIVPCLSF